MKFAATILLLAICAACIGAQHITNFGNVTNTRLLSEQRVTVASSVLQVKTRTLTFNTNGPTVIRGISHLDFKTRSRVTPTIAGGGIGQNNAAVRIVSQRGHGIESVVRFFG